MARIFQTFDSFTSGEVSPRLRGRVDLDQYNNGLRTLQNFTIQPHGGVSRRQGTTYVTAAKSNSNNIRLIPFEFSSEQAYVLEVSAGSIRFYKPGGNIVLDAPSITNGDFSDTTLTGWVDNSDGTGSIAASGGGLDLVTGTSGNEAITYQELKVGTAEYTITVTTDASTAYRVGTTIDGSDITSGTVNGVGQTFTFTPTNGGRVYLTFENSTASTTVNIDDVSISVAADTVFEISNPWANADITELQYAQSADVLYICHENYAPRKLSRFSDDEWVLEEFSAAGGPFYDITDTVYGGEGTGINCGVSASSGTGVTVTANTSTRIFQTTDVGRLFRYRHSDSTSAKWGYGTITAVGSDGTTCTIDWVENAESTTSNDQWSLGSWSDTTGYPKAVSFHEQRLWFAGSTDQSQTLWGSFSGDINNFAPYEEDPDATSDEQIVTATTGVSFTIASNKANSIFWLSSAVGKLFIGTSGEVFLAQASSLDEAITADNITIKPIVTQGSKYALPAKSQNANIFIGNYGRRLYELGYFFEEDSYRAADLTLLAEHITEGKLQELSLQESPDNILWAITEDGNLLGLTYLRAEKVIGWHKHELGGSDVSVQSITTIPGTDEDEVWLCVSRTINGSTVQYIEYIAPTFTTEALADQKKKGIFVDCSGVAVASEEDTITGITQANPAVVTTSGAHGLSDGDKVKISGVVGMTEVNSYTFTVANSTSTTFELLNTNSTGYTAYSSGGTVLKLINTISGLSYLEGETVDILADGAVLPSETVASGSITLDRHAEYVIVGLGYESILETNNIEVKGPVGTIQGSTGAIYETIARFYKTLGGKIGYNDTTTDTILFRDGSSNMDASPDLFTGDKRILFPHGYESELRVYIKQDQPLPMSVLMLVNKFEISTN